ncbi:uncharacterized protein BBA_08864 [Beauveria bassiana ARSEF 2860]|uniref:Uncharacterized protein n=1 Tax=Beauveria bassiana (strain ARSEF 2860) TaxID=655819 RepID=J4VUK8_BEAB2|nr:uncharacterized protein BBA_08864 [Beauveria bassiana ARSEF 2860]EJP62190.1 hypothetical protein BBA_08864 [Beauveria bassiana ARSEF 2860]
MSDAKVMRYSDDDAVVTVQVFHSETAFSLPLVCRLLNHPDRSFALEVSIDLERANELLEQKPPLHFHAQEEYIEAIQGKIGLEIDGREIVLTPKDGRYAIMPYADHRTYPMLLDQQEPGTSVVKFLLSGEKTDAVFELNPPFFENWYNYQKQIVMHGEKLSLLQLFSTFDAGGTYVSLPNWIPFGQTLSICAGVVIGRWIGGMLGYQPFYRKWTTDWDLACTKMEASFFQRRFANRSLKKDE